jgi:hypothetical protein
LWFDLLEPISTENLQKEEYYIMGKSKIPENSILYRNDIIEQKTVLTSIQSIMFAFPEAVRS